MNIGGLIRKSHKDNKVRFVALMESGVLVDEQADVIQTQVIAHQARASIRNRDAVPLYHQRAEGHPPVWRENVLLETGLARPPTHDTRYVQQDSGNLWRGIRSGALAVEDPMRLSDKHILIVAYLGAIAFMLTCAWFAGIQNADAPVVAPVQQEVQQEGSEGKGSIDEDVVDDADTKEETPPYGGTGTEPGGDGADTGEGPAERVGEQQEEGEDRGEDSRDSAEESPPYIR